MVDDATRTITAAAGRASGRSRRRQQAGRDACILELDGEGLTPAEIARRVGCHRGTVGRVLGRYPGGSAERWGRLGELAAAGRFDDAETMVLSRLARAAAPSDAAALAALESLRIAHVRSRRAGGGRPPS